MSFDVTLGQYYETNSPIHKLDPRSKLFFVVLFLVATFMAKSVFAFALLVFAIVFFVLLSKVPLRIVLKGLKPLVIIVLFTAILNIFWTKGENLLWKGEIIKGFWYMDIYLEGLINAALFAVRIVTLLIGTSLFFSYATTPIELTDGIEVSLSPLKKIKVPVHEFARMMTIALRFIPTLIEETEKIMNAQKSRGADFSSGSLVKRAKALIPILIPLFVSSFKRADELAVAMECRCYRGDKKRTKLVKLTYRALDFIWFGVGILFLGAVIYLKITPAHISSILPDGVFKILFYRV